MVVKITEASTQDMEKLEDMYKKLYNGDEKQKFYNSKISITEFKSGQIILVAKDRDKIVGYCWLIWYNHIKEKGVGYLEELYVEEDMRNQGIGKDLIKNVISLLKDMEIRTIYLAVGKHMGKAQEFYKYNGFTQSEEQWFEKKL